MSTSTFTHRITRLPASRGDGAWSTALWAAYTSRVVVWVAAMIGIAIRPPSAALVSSFNVANYSAQALTQPFGSALLNRLIAPAGRFDSVWYLAIARHGYFTGQAHAFFPLYPLTVGLISDVTGQPLIVGLIVSLACFTGALVLLYRLVLLDFDARVARLSVWLMALFPMSLFFSAVYTESMFTLLSIAAIYAARRERWLLSGVVAAMAAATRSDGFVLIVPLAWIYLWGPRPGAPRPEIDWSTPAGLLKRLSPRILLVCLAPVGLIAYLVYCAASGWSFTEPFHAASFYWGRSFKGPFSEIVVAIRHFFSHDLGAALSDTHVHTFFIGDPLNWTWDNVIDVVWLVPVIAALVACWRRCPRVYFAYALLIIVASASNPSPLEPMMSFARYIMPAFPLMVGAAAVLVDRPIAKWSAIALSGVALAAFSALWGIWAWVA